jgi:hypothetical protein
MQEYHRQLFANSSDELRQEIQRITGMEVREATAEIEPVSGAVVQAFTTGQLFEGSFQFPPRVTIALAARQSDFAFLSREPAGAHI